MLQTEPKILVVEDNTQIQSLLKGFFKKRGYQAVITPDGVDVVALAKEHKPLLIFMDIMMPGKDGIEACTDLRQAGIKTPILMLTSKFRDEDKQRALKAGADAYLLKPINPAELEAAMLPLLKQAP